MQIHELNTFAGTPGDGNYLAIDNGSDTGKISGTKLLEPVNDRIDNLITNVTPDSVVTLIDSDIITEGTYALSESVANFDFLDFYFEDNDGNGKYTNYVRVPRNKMPVNLRIPYSGGLSKELYMQEMTVNASGTTLTVSNAKLWEWDGDKDSGASVQSSVWILELQRVDGVKISPTTPAELADLRLGFNGKSYGSAGAQVRGSDTMLADQIDNIAENYTIPGPYFYKANTYINNSGVETALSGFDLYKIPFGAHNVIAIDWSAAFWGGLSQGYIYTLEDTGGNLIKLSGSTATITNTNFTKNQNIFVNDGTYVALYVSIEAASVGNVKISINSPNPKVKENLIYGRGIFLADNNNAIESPFYIKNDSTISFFNAGYLSRFLKVKAGDRVGYTDALAAGLSYRGRIRYDDGTESNLNQNGDTFAQGGICSFYLATTSDAPVVYPGDSIKIEAANVIKEETEEIDPLSNIVNQYTILTPYLYKENTYIDNNGIEVDYPGYNLYKIPIDTLDILQIKWIDGNEFFGAIALQYVFRILKTDDTYLIPTQGVNNANYVVPTVALKADSEAIFLKDSTYKAVMVTAKADKVQYAAVYKNKLFPDLNQENLSGAYKLGTNNAIRSKYYISTSDIFNRFPGDYYVYFKKLKSGDRIDISGTITGLSFLGSFRDSSGTRTSIASNATSFTAPSDGILCVFINTNMTKAYTYFPKDSIQIDGSNILNFTGGDNQFQGLAGVAFGTSLTYRSLNSYGYLTTLEALSGVTFDNQGIGSSKIISNMLAAIKAYTGYSNKVVCLLEGFVNDWYGNEPLGTWRDTTESTVCGCVRSALNYMLSQNANMTVFLILDHYGRLVGAVDCSSTAVNGAGLTQYEYYDEIAKVAKSLGIPVLREYEVSGISENTPQYLADNIHLNSLGAQQSGTAIWYEMKEYPVNL